MYKCIARYRGYSFSSRQAFVSVTKSPLLLVGNVSKQAIIQARPEFDTWPEDVETELNEEVTFECKALNLGSRVYEYTWLKDGVVLNPTARNDSIRLVNGNNLRINSVQRQDSGTYTCRICSQVMLIVCDTCSSAGPNQPECDERSGKIDLLGKLTC